VSVSARCPRVVAAAALLCSVTGATLVGAMLSGGCSETTPEFDLAGARRATLTVVVREVVSFRDFRPLKEVRFGLRGAPAGASGADRVETVQLDAEIIWLALTYRDKSGAEVSMATDSAGDEPTFEPLVLARRAVLEALVDGRVAIGFARDGSISTLVGLGAALTAAGERATSEGVDSTYVVQAVSGLAQLLDDQRVLHGLRGAGVAAAPPEVARGRGTVERHVDAYVAGRGVTGVTAIGKAGTAASGAPTVAFEARIGTDAEFTGDGGAEPPDAIGAVIVDGVRIVVSTEYATGSLQPLRGHFSVESPHAGGPLVTRSVEFILLVDG